jgi:hypothetical protein
MGFQSVAHFRLRKIEIHPKQCYFKLAKQRRLQNMGYIQDIFIRFLCGLCLPDLKIIQAGEKPDCRQAGFVFPLRLYFTANAKKLRPPDRIIRAGEGRKAG